MNQLVKRCPKSLISSLRKLYSTRIKYPIYKSYCVEIDGRVITLPQHPYAKGNPHMAWTKYCEYLFKIHDDNGYTARRIVSENVNRKALHDYLQIQISRIQAENKGKTCQGPCRKPE